VSVAKNFAFKNHPKDILHDEKPPLHDENHLYGIVLVLAFKTRKYLQVAGY